MIHSMSYSTQETNPEEETKKKMKINFTTC